MLESKKFVPDWAYSLPDPTLNFGLANVPSGSFALDRENMTQKQIGVAQFFPAPGKRKKLRSVAEDDIDIAAAMVPERRLELIKMARVLSYRLKYLQKARLIVLKNEETLRGFIRIALTKYEVGLGLQTDVLLAQVELSKMSDLLMRIEQKIRSTGDMLATMASYASQSRFILRKATGVARIRHFHLNGENSIRSKSCRDRLIHASATAL